MWKAVCLLCTKYGGNPGLEGNCPCLLGVSTLWSRWAAGTPKTAWPRSPWHTSAATGHDYSGGGHLPHEILEITREGCVTPDIASCSEVADGCSGAQAGMGQRGSQIRCNLCPRCVFSSSFSRETALHLGAQSCQGAGLSPDRPQRFQHPPPQP